MQVTAISNSHPNKQNFQGNINIVNDLSYLPCKYVRKAYSAMEEMIKDKPFDLFIKQNHPEKSISMIAKKPEHLGKINKPFMENIIIDASTMDNGSDTVDLYTAVARETINTYDKAFPTISTGEKIKKFLNKLGNKFVNTFQDKDEI